MAHPRLVYGLKALPHPPRRAVVTIGVFDGVHLAHQHLIRTTIRWAKRLRGTSVVITFDPDPHHVLDPRHAPPALMPLNERLQALAALGVGYVIVVPFTKRFARMTASTFVRQILQRRLHAVAVVLGEAFLFGRNRQGDMETLRTLGNACGMRVVSVSNVRRDGAVISSSRIRRLIAGGRLAQARRLLGRPPTLHGVVVRGAGRGRRVGFPTANLRLQSLVLPPQGVYAVWVYARRSPRRGQGVMNLGRRPTFGGGDVVCEVHVLNFSGRLLGRSVIVSLVARLRGERCFPSREALSRQVRRDIRRARHLLIRSLRTRSLLTSHF